MYRLVMAFVFTILTFYFSSDLVIRNKIVLARHTQFIIKLRGKGDTGHPPS